MTWRGLTTPPWEAIRIHLPKPKVTVRGGRPRVEDQYGLEGILWMLRTGAPWGERPRRYGRPTTGGRRLQAWEETGVLRKR
jgi:transposase